MQLSFAICITFWVASVPVSLLADGFISCMSCCKIGIDWAPELCVPCRKPTSLYERGLQRDLFLPFIGRLQVCATLPHLPT